MAKTVFSGSMAELGRQPSILAPSMVGFMRRLGLTVAGIGALGAIGLAYSRWEAQHPVLRQEVLEMGAVAGAGAPQNMHPLRILHVSDLHMFPGQDFIKDFLAQIADEHQIDLVISTGDNLGDKESIDDLLAAYEPLLRFPGAFVLGSNDYYSPLTKNWLNYLKRDRAQQAINRHNQDQPDLPWLQLVTHLTEAGWVDLSNRSQAIRVPTEAGPQLVAMLGVDDPHIQRDRLPETFAEWDEPGALRLGLTHAPYQRILTQFANQSTDLIFAGHTHGGQVRVPGVGAIVTNCDLPGRYSRGLHYWLSSGGSGVSGVSSGSGVSGVSGVSGGSFFNVSAGLGTSPFAPIRFACRPEATLIEVTPGGFVSPSHRNPRL